MIAFIPLSMPAAWLIDARGLRVAVGLGVVLMAVFGVLRGLAGADYTLALLAHDRHRRGTAVPAQRLDHEVPATGSRRAPAGDGRRAGHAGQPASASALGMVLTPVLIENMSIAGVQLLYGVRRGGFGAALPGARARAAGDAALPARHGSARAHARRTQARPDRPAVPGVSRRRLHRHGHLQRRHHLGGADHPPARLQPDGRRHSRRPPAARRAARRGDHLGALGPPGQAHALPRPRAWRWRSRACSA